MLSENSSQIIVVFHIQVLIFLNTGPFKVVTIFTEMHGAI